ncbi:MAG TPA: C45 family autoproteolytic acyltransferase/hydrolase [Oligoflexia bacterium]|nr:C45 family autoproteolytic acyltransferase/hydrolase [Oligoflexia bacterium]HMP27063.1 C45 family autoproteolytic acyltransferase/hydrolase [Oligoflexia bacterium]
MRLTRTTSLFFVALFLASCSMRALVSHRIDQWNVLIRSDVITNSAQEKEIVNKAQRTATTDGIIPVVILQGSPYERGYQHGYLFRQEIQKNLSALYKGVVSKFMIAEILDEAFERQRPFIKEEEFEEMRGLAHGARIPISLVHRIHAIPELSEWGGKKRIRELVKTMIKGEDLGTSCSNFAALPNYTGDGVMYVTRILDWGLHRVSELHKYPLISVHIPDKGIPFANIGWAGFIGAVSGMNGAGITLGEMGYGDFDNETLSGRPMIFMLRELLQNATTLQKAEEIVSTSTPTNSYVFLFADGKTKNASIIFRDRERFEKYSAGQKIYDPKREVSLPAISNLVYAGHYREKMAEKLDTFQGKLKLEELKSELIPAFAMPSNFQNVIYLPENLTFWVNYAANSKTPAIKRSFTFFDLGAIINLQ